MIIPLTQKDNLPVADPKLVLPIALKVSKFGVEVVGLHSSYPDVPGHGYVQAATEGQANDVS